MKEKENEPLLNSEGAPSLGCDINADRAISTKKRDTSFVETRKKQIELYGNYYSSGLSDEGIISWANLELEANEQLNVNLRKLISDTEAKIESARQAKLSATLAGLSETEKEQLKVMLA